jgi:hypothetical protein
MGGACVTYVGEFRRVEFWRRHLKEITTWNLGADGRIILK